MRRSGYYTGLFFLLFKTLDHIDVAGFLHVVSFNISSKYLISCKNGYHEMQKFGVAVVLLTHCPV